MIGLCIDSVLVCLDLNNSYSWSLIGTTSGLNIEVQRGLAVPITATGITLDPKSDEPLYRQLFDQIVSRIRKGTFPSGYRLAPTRTWPKELHTHRNTGVGAYQNLEDAAFVRRN